MMYDIPYSRGFASEVKYIDAVGSVLREQLTYHPYVWAHGSFASNFIKPNLPLSNVAVLHCEGTKRIVDHVEIPTYRKLGRMSSCPPNGKGCSWMMIFEADQGGIL